MITQRLFLNIKNVKCTYCYQKDYYTDKYTHTGQQNKMKLIKILWWLKKKEKKAVAKHSKIIV